MKKQFFILSVAVAAMLPISQASADPIELLLKVWYEDPSEDDNPFHRSPVLIPSLYIDGYTLTAGDYTLGSTIQLLDEDDNVVFSTYVAIEGDIQLPATLSGTYTIEVIRGDITFVGEIEL